MMEYRCVGCGCYLDPGEGRLCDECRKKEAQAPGKMPVTSAESHRMGKRFVEAGA